MQGWCELPASLLPGGNSGDLSHCSLVGTSEQEPHARDRRGREPRCGGCHQAPGRVLAASITTARKMVKKGDVLQTSPYPHAAGKPGWAEALLAARSSHPPLLLAPSPIETRPSRMGTPGILPPAAGAPGRPVHAGTPAPGVARAPRCQHHQPWPRLLPHDCSAGQRKQPSSSAARLAFPPQPPYGPSGRLGSVGREGVNPLITPTGE